MKLDKTNALRLLDAAGAAYTTHAYDPELTDGELVADAVGAERDRVFKTLVTRGGSGAYHVFAVPVNCKLSLKKAAAAAGEKSVSMLPQRELFPLTGYVHGGCSPLGMKKSFPTWINDTAELFESICVSAGRRGLQMEVSPGVLAELAGAGFADLTEE